MAKQPKKFINKDGVNVLNPEYLEWKKKDKAGRRTPCYVIPAKAVHGSVSDDGHDSEDESEDEHVAYHINSKLYSMISDIRSGHPSNLQLRNADQSNGST